MPTKNPRVNVTLSPSLDALVSNLAKLQRVSKSQVMRELFEAVEPELRRAVVLMEAAAQATTEMKSRLVRTMDAEQTRLEAVVDEHVKYMHSATSDLVSEAQAIRSRRPSRGLVPAKAGAKGKGGGSPRGVSDPPSSNRGVRKGKTGSEGSV